MNYLNQLFCYSFNRLLVCLLSIHHISELVFHISQLIQTMDKDEKFTKGTFLMSFYLLKFYEAATNAFKIKFRIQLNHNFFFRNKLFSMFAHKSFRISLI